MSSKSTRALKRCVPASLAVCFPNHISQRPFARSAINGKFYSQQLARKSSLQDACSQRINGGAAQERSGPSATAPAESTAVYSRVIQDGGNTAHAITITGATAHVGAQGTDGGDLYSDSQKDRTGRHSSVSKSSARKGEKGNRQQRPPERRFPSRLTKRLVNRKLPGPDAKSDLVPWDPRAAKNAWSFPPAARHVPLEPGGDPEFLPNSNEFAQEWVKLYKQLIFPVDGDLTRAQRELDVLHRQAAAQFVKSTRLKDLRNAWLRLGLNQRVQILPSILIGCLIDSARKTLSLLSILPMLPREWKTRCECLLYVDLVHREEVEKNPDLQSMFANQIKHVSKVWSFPEGSMPRAFLVLLLRHNSPEHSENIIDTVLQSSAPVPVPLILVMVDHYVKQGKAERALELLAKIPVDQREPFKQPILDRLPSLVNLDSIEEFGPGRNFKILPRLMAIGMPLDANVHNRLLQRAVSLRLTSVAWEVFNFMETENIHVDARSHLVLLRDSFDRQDREKLDRVLSAIHQRKDLYQDPYLVAYTMHIVRIVCCFDRKLPPEVCFAHILAIYDRAYDRAPLVKLGLADPLPAEQDAVAQLPQPRPAALGFTIWAYVLCQSDEKPVSRLWHWIAHLVQHGDSTMCEAAKHDILYNGFVSFFSRQPSTLQKGAEVVEEMMELGLCMPTQRTWSELLSGFLRHGEEDAAEKIWRTMLARGVLPSAKEWSFLLTRYDKSRLSQLVRHVLNEREMPEGLESALGLAGQTHDQSSEPNQTLLGEPEYAAEELVQDR
ncbi:hypothetical protein HRR83_002110 [Exophiala dermatitidis]|uniref:Pentatricopeptide repeat domain-containing protein n=1 Tax=Exophiala dermatitidis TaxID=5970 RepID=A0AAN6EY13_EXODE|nr:hypothetical protein HRR75_002009 [Exophiala dermatitidis]KAJ4523992.1 hypothetical protein HRR74_002187 [Exophiala dermatitidis]KAJ4525738.1 hypothetical protein HRR73_002470 [Exophiala dermatitidis]KAJ4537064.1 hypothetical protein HRR76_005081 [Exophiala dermatitidis]KAJ4555338.1 hypothetical protein HRR77_001274 [Exophiala dermatitidis]